jgi:hypothetical protein
MDQGGDLSRPCLASDSDQQTAASGAIELAEVDSLPGSERHAPVNDWHHYGKAHQGCLDMGVGITFSMAVISRRWHKPGQAGKDILGYIRVSVLVDSQASRRMRHVNIADTTFHAGFRQFSCHSARDIQNLDSGTSRNIDLCPLHILFSVSFPDKIIVVTGRDIQNLLPGMATIMQKKRNY